MKKILLLLTIVALSSCTKDDIDNTGYNSNDGYITFTSGDAEGTRTAIKVNDGDDNDEIVWQAGDKIGIYSPQIYAARNYAAGVSSADAGKRRATFVTDLQYGSAATHTFYAYYPYSANNSTSNSTTTISGNLTPSQDGAIAANAFMWAKTTVEKGSQNIALEFQHPFTYLDVKLKSSTKHIGKKLHTLTFIAEEGKALAGNYTLNFTTGAIEFSNAYNTVSATADITLASEAKDLYMVINPADLAETTVKIIAVLKDGNGSLTTLQTTKAGKTFTAQTRTEMTLDVDVMTDASAEPVPVADDNFKELLLAAIDADPDITPDANTSQVSFAEIQKIKTLVVGERVDPETMAATASANVVLANAPATRADSGTEITSIQGVEFMTSLEEFHFKRTEYVGVPESTVLDLSNNPNLKKIYTFCGYFSDVILGDKPALQDLYLYEPRLTALDISKAPNLVTFTCASSYNLANLVGITDCPKLEYLKLNTGSLLSLDVSNNSNLEYLYCQTNKLEELKGLSNCAKIVDLYISSYSLTSLDVSNSAATLKTLEVNCGKLESLNGVAECTKLEKLKLLGAKITSLDVSKLVDLEVLTCNGAKIGTLDVTKNTKLKELSCTSCGLTALDISKNTALQKLLCSDNSLTQLNLTNNTELVYLDCSRNSLSGELQLNNCSKIEQVFCASNDFVKINVNSNAAATTLNRLDCQVNKQLTSIGEGMEIPALQYLFCSYTGFTTLDFSKYQALTMVTADNMTNLESVTLDNPNLTSLSFNRCSKLKTLDISKTGVNGSTSYSSCKSDVLETLVLGDRNWVVKGIYPERNTSYIAATTEIVFANEL